MERTRHLSIRGGLPTAVVICVAAAATAASLFIRWGAGGRYSLGPTLPWAYFISATVVAWVLSSPRVLPQCDSADWRSRLFATVYGSIGIAAAVTVVLNVVLLYPSGVQRDVHSMFVSERILFTLIGPLMYLVPLAIAVPTSLLILVGDRYKALTVGAFTVLVFTVLLGFSEVSAEYLLLLLGAR